MTLSVRMAAKDWHNRTLYAFMRLFHKLGSFVSFMYPAGLSLTNNADSEVIAVRASSPGSLSKFKPCA